MWYIEAPTEFIQNRPAIFLAGGISDAEDWQHAFVRLLPDGDYSILNPRRRDFPQGDPLVQTEQIEWEHQHLQKADLVTFWFPPQTLCPIALFELGTCCSAGTPIAVGADPGYARRFDVWAQLQLRRPDVELVDSLEALSRQVAEHCGLKGASR